MMKRLLCLALAAVLCPAWGAERIFDFGAFPLNGTPPGFRSAASVTGRPGDWKLVQDEVTPLIAPLTPQARTPKRHVLAQVAEDPADEHYPILIFEEETYGDFTFSTRFKIVSGTVARMAGIAFRIQDENNYYVLRASASGNTLRFYKFVGGQRSVPIGPDIPVPAGVWHDLSVTCKGTEIRCSFNGQDAIPPMTDTSFAAGKIGFWTKSDSVTHFSDARIIYTPREPVAQALVRSTMKRYPRLRGLQMYAFAGPENSEVRMIASSNEEEIGTAGGEKEENVLRTDAVYYGKNKTPDGERNVSVLLPLHDRNGETVAALRLIMEPFPGQMEKVTLARTIPIRKMMESQIRSVKDLMQ
jgi:hypothetical protein